MFVAETKLVQIEAWSVFFSGKEVGYGGSFLSRIVLKGGNSALLATLRESKDS